MILALIKKFVDAKMSGSRTVEVCDTRKASREFLYVDDAAKDIRLAAEKYDSPEPVNNDKTRSCTKLSTSFR